MKCLECNKTVKSINFRHLKFCCNLTPTEYKVRHPDAELMDESVKKLCVHCGENNASWKKEKHKSNWSRTCDCGNTVIHKSWDGFSRANKLGTCNKCHNGLGSWQGKHHSIETKQKISQANKGKEYNNSNLGKPQSNETKNKIGQASKGNQNWLGRKHTVETRHKMSKKRSDMLVERFGDGQISPWYNKEACKLFEEINKELGWNGLHAENGGEVRVSGYFLDYYEPTQNIVIEFNEKRHEIPSVAEKDRIKQEIVTNLFKCRFFRIKNSEAERWNEIIK